MMSGFPSASIRSVCVVGLGSVGVPTAEHFASRGISTYGYDLSPRAVKSALSKLDDVSTSLADLPLADLYVVTVDTGLQGEVPFVENVFKACAAIAARGHPQLVSIESTVPMGTCRRLYDEIFEGQGDLVHIPHRWWAGDIAHHGVAQPRVIGSINHEAFALALDFYGRAGIPLLPVADIRIAELCKVAENTDRYLKIAFAELLKMICDEHDLDLEELRRAMNSKWNVDVLEARQGIGGSCLPKDILYLKAAAPGLCHILDGARSVDEAYRTRGASRWRRSYPS